MNWTDLAVICIILIFAIIGLYNGFIFSIFRLGSFFISVFVSVKYNPVMARLLRATTLDENILKSIKHALMIQQQSTAPQIDSQVKEAAADSIIRELQLPSFLKNKLIAHTPSPSKILPIEQIIDVVSEGLTDIVINIISLILLYIAIRVALAFARFIFKGIAKLPVFRQVDKFGGFALGAVEGLLSIYLIMALLMLFNSASKFKPVFDALNTSVIAKFFYQNNFIINWMLK